MENNGYGRMECERCACALNRMAGRGDRSSARSVGKKKTPWLMEMGDYANFNNDIVRKYKETNGKELIAKYEELDKKLDKLVHNLGEEELKADKRV